MLSLMLLLGRTGEGWWSPLSDASPDGRARGKGDEGSPLSASPDGPSTGEESGEWFSLNAGCASEPSPSMMPDKPGAGERGGQRLSFNIGW